MSRDNHAENRVFRKRLHDQKLLFGGCRACFGDLETAFKKFKNFIFRFKIYDFLVIFSPWHLYSANERARVVLQETYNKKLGKVGNRIKNGSEPWWVVKILDQKSNIFDFFFNFDKKHWNLLLLDSVVNFMSFTANKSVYKIKKWKIFEKIHIFENCFLTTRWHQIKNSSIPNS